MFHNISCFYCIFNQINAALLNLRDLTDSNPKLLNGSVWPTPDNHFIDFACY